MKRFWNRCSTRSATLRRSVSSFLFLALLLGGCSAAELEERSLRAENLASAEGWRRDLIETDTFTLAAWLGPRSGETLTIYLEGDGFAWATSSKPSFNPTPENPIGLQLALNHLGSSAAYLARPCQYVELADEPLCDARAWTRDRFGEAVVAAANRGIALLKDRYDATALELVGYSGGGAIAVLVAARRNDVSRLITVAAPLDHELWTSSKRHTPLYGSLNPVSVSSKVADLTQIHYVGAEDAIVDLSLARSFASEFSATSPIHIYLIVGFDHHCCWADEWAWLQQGRCPESLCSSADR